MKSISAIEAVKKIKASQLRLITPQQLAKLLDLTNQNTLYKLIQRLISYQLLKRISPGKYILFEADISDFEIANLLITNSYVSLESALSFYGILAQYSYEITSVTVDKSSSTSLAGKSYTFSHISPKLYWGYQKKDQFLIAKPEKAVVDFAYLASKGLRKAHPAEWDISNLDRERFKDYCKKVTFTPFQKFLVKWKLL